MIGQLSHAGSANTSTELGPQRLQADTTSSLALPEPWAGTNCSLLTWDISLQDVYTDSGMKRKGNNFPLQEVLRVSQDSRQLWLNQRPFKLRRGKTRHPSRL